MADYYPLLARAIGGLPDKSAEGRKAVYERARRALTAQLRAVEPPLADDDVEREQQALENAIRRLEADHGGTVPTVAAPPVSPPATPAPPPVAPPQVSAPPVPPPISPPSRPPNDFASSDFTASDAEAVAAGIAPEGRAGGNDWRSEAARMVRAREQAATEGAPEPPPADDLPPETADEPRGSGRGKLVAVLIFLALLIGGAVVGYTQRDTIVALIAGATSPAAPTPSAQAPARPVTPDAPKSTDRIAQASDNSRQSAPTQSAQPQQNSPGATPAPQSNAAPRAVLFEESPGGGEQGLQQYQGTIAWRTENVPGNNGMAPDVGIRADIAIPDRDITATLTIRRNQDSSIPASHIVEVQFKLPPNFDLGNVSNVPGMRAKASEGAQGDPLVGLAVRVAPSYFLIGLSALNNDIQRNLSLLLMRNWLDLPLVFENGRRAILALEKGRAGNQAFRQAFSDWGLKVPGEDETPAQ